MNKVILIGRLTKDPELKHTSSGISVVQFTVAVNRRFQAQDGSRQADFINCVVWRGQAENLAKYVRKGAMIGIEGQIQVRNYEDNGGVKRYVTEVICDNITFLESKGSASNSGFGDVDQYDIPSERQQSSYQQSYRQDAKQEDPFNDISSNHNINDDDLPF